MKARGFGLACLAVAALAAWWGIWQPLQAAEAGAERVRYSLAVFVLVPAAGVFGLFFLLLGDRVPYRDATRQSPTLVGWALLLAMAAGSAAGYAWFKERMTSAGYLYSGAQRTEPAGEFTPSPIPRPPHVDQPDFTSGSAERN
jgi:hypothetical protein